MLIVRCVTFWRAYSVPTSPERWEEGRGRDRHRNNEGLGTLLRNALPLIGLGVAVIVNAAWIGFLGYFVLRLV
jgi:hypothetical protein